jgi:hypothetical protein
MTPGLESSRYDAVPLVVIGLQAARDEAPLLGPGAPLDLVDRLEAEPLPEGRLLDAARAAQVDRGVPLIVLGGEAVATARAVLDEPEIARALLLIVGTGPAVNRAALEELPWLSWTRVRHVDLELVPPRVPEGPVADLQGGLGLVVLDIDTSGRRARTPGYRAMARLLPELTSAWVPERFTTAELEAGRQAQATVAMLTSSTSWRVTAPLRAAMQAMRRRS